VQPEPKQATDPAPVRSHPGWIALRVLFGLAGIAAVAWLVREVGVDALEEAILPALPWLPLALALEVARIGMDALSSHYSLRREDRVPAWPMFAAHLVAYAVMGVAPAGRATSEVVKASLLARWSIRAERTCLDELRERGVRAELFRTHLTPIPTPVRIQSDIGGVHYRKRPGALHFIISCELAVRLARAAPIFRAHGIETIDVSSSWRRAPNTSFHRMGLALDIQAFHGTRGTWVVEGQYPVDRTAPTCPVTAEAPPLRRLACELAASGHLSTVITPSYNLSHHNHFHIDARPDDPRVFVR